MKYDPLVTISKYAGMREDIVQAGGGNTSWKLDNHRMRIKASGCLLAEVDTDRGYTEVNPEIIREFFLKNDGREFDEDDEKQLLEYARLTDGHPSIETFLHSMTDTLTLHTHPVQVNILAARTGGMDMLQELFPEALVVGYAKPGIQLAKELFSAMHKRSDMICTTIFLKNHGLIVSGKTAEEVIHRHEAVLTKIEESLKLNFAGDHAVTSLWQALGGTGSGHIVWRVTDYRILRAVEAGERFFPHAISPDCIVYCGKKLLAIQKDIEKEAKEHLRKYGPFTVITWQGEFYIYAPSVRKALEIQSVLAFEAQVLWHNRENSCDFLSEQEQDLLLHWDAEKYRRELT